MSPALLPAKEAERLAALRSYDVLDTTSEEVFDDLAALAARLTGSPLAFVSLVDERRVWFKAHHGLNVTEVSRDHGFCAQLVLDSDRPLVVEDMTVDIRFQDNPLVTGTPDIRAYLGVPLIDGEGYVLGSLCVLDRRTRTFDDDTIATVRTLARAVIVNLALRRALSRSRKAALTDPLTGLPNRRAAIEALSMAAKRSEPVVAVMVDLDYFKEINDGEGHAAGDALLQAAGQRLLEAVRPGDFVGRVGGDEFLVLLSGAAVAAAVTGIAQRISAALHRPVPHGDKALRLGATLGIAAVPDDIADPDLLLRIADEALIRAKREKRGSIGRARPGDAAELVRAAVVAQAFQADAATDDPLRGAMVHLQPILQLGDASRDGCTAILAFEALARWSGPGIGAVAPDELFRVIGPERAAELGRVVRQKALAAYAALRKEGLAEGRIALNLSASEVCRADIALEVSEQVEQAGLSLSCLEVEITEEVLLDRVSDRTLDQLAALRGRGARLILDDFGTGNSGLSQLLRLPLDGVKLDKRFVQRLGVDARAEEIVRATVSMAHGLGLCIVAEGVETAQQAAMLRALHCDAAQGYLYAHPLSPIALRAWLTERRLHAISGITVLRPSFTRNAS